MTTPQPGWLVIAGLLLLVFVYGMAYVAVRGSTARGTVAALATGENFQGLETPASSTSSPYVVHETAKTKPLLDFLNV